MIDLPTELKRFATYHRDPGNRALHIFGILGTTVAILGLLAMVPLYAWVDLAVALLAATLVIDLMLDWRIALGVAVTGVACWLVGRVMPGWSLGALLVLGLAAQIAGHRLFEKNAPAFTVNMIHLFVGPRWLVNRALRVLPEQ